MSHRIRRMRRLIVIGDAHRSNWNYRNWFRQCRSMAAVHGWHLTTEFARWNWFSAWDRGLTPGQAMYRYLNDRRRAA